MKEKKTDPPRMSFKQEPLHCGETTVTVGIQEQNKENSASKIPYTYLTETIEKGVSVN